MGMQWYKMTVFIHVPSTSLVRTLGAVKQLGRKILSYFRSNSKTWFEAL